MNHITNSKGWLEFFTARRYTEYQDSGKGEEDWEQQIELYGDYLESLDGVMLPNVKRFIKTCHLHDADFDRWSNIGIHREKTQLILRQKNWGDLKFLCLLRYLQVGDYQNGADIQTHNGPGFYKDVIGKPHVNPHWLYDEWHHLGTADGALGKQEVFSHAILLSNGVEMRIMFSEFDFIYIPIGEGFIDSQEK